MAHKDILISFEIDDRHYEAVGFLNDGEPSVSRKEMLRRTDDENSEAIDYEDEEYLSSHKDQLPSILKTYKLATPNWCAADMRYASIFHFDSECGIWRYGGILPDSPMDEYWLVLRRVRQ